MKTKYLFLFLFSLISLSLFSQKTIKVACVGNSITYGSTIENREMDAYPAQLQRMLGGKYLVNNFGKPGATLLRKGHRPYIDQQEFKDAMAFEGDIVVIHLGVNDTDPRNWPNYRDDFIGDYHALIDSFRQVNPQVKIFIARMTPIFDRHPRFESGTRDWHSEIQNAIETVAAYSDVSLIDFYSPLHSYPWLFADAIHPNAEGAGILAKIVYEAISGDCGGLQMNEIYTDNMVIQRDIPLIIKGKANAREKVTVQIAKQKQTVTTDDNGQWQAELKPLKAGGPYTLSVSTDKKSLTYSNVLAGEVWLCSGQSNMEFMMNQCMTGAIDIPKAANDNIRLYDLKANWRTNAEAWNESALDSVNHLEYYRNTSWQTASPETVKDFSAIAYYFGKMLQDSLQVPVGLICNAVGGSTTESWIARTTIEKSFPSILKNWINNDFIQGWARERAALNIQKSQNKLQRHPYEPCYLYEASINSLSTYPIKGVIWYQGESNAHNKDAHEKLFRLLTESWRSAWNDAALPIYYVQLSSLDRPSWPWFRDSQRRLMSEIPNIGMAVSSDKGDSLDVHPKAKKEIGHRLALWALNKSYHHKNTTPSGPLYDKMKIEGASIEISFKYGEGLQSSDGKELKSFEISGTDGIFHPAKAEITKEGLRLSSPKVSHPVKARYAWQPFTRANLVNKSGLPASTFITE